MVFLCNNEKWALPKTSFMNRRKEPLAEMFETKSMLLLPNTSSNLSSIAKAMQLRFSSSSTKSTIALHKTGYWKCPKITSLCCLFIASFLLINPISAQDAGTIPYYFDSLKIATSDSMRVEFLWRIGFNYSQSNPDSGIFYAQKSHQLAKRINYQKGLGDSENIWGFSLSSAGEYDSANVHYEKALKHFQALNDPCNTTVVLGNWGWNYMNHHEDVKGLECFLEAEKLDRACDARGWKSTTYYNIGAAYNRMNEYAKATTYFDQAISIDELKLDSAKLAISTLGKANALRGMNNLKEAEVYYKRAMYINERLENE